MLIGMMPFVLTLQQLLLLVLYIVTLPSQYDLCTTQGVPGVPGPPGRQVSELSLHGTVGQNLAGIVLAEFVGRIMSMVFVLFNRGRLEGKEHLVLQAVLA